MEKAQAVGIFCTALNTIEVFADLMSPRVDSWSKSTTLHRTSHAGAPFHVGRVVAGGAGTAPGRHTSEVLRQLDFGDETRTWPSRGHLMPLPSGIHVLDLTVAGRPLRRLHWAISGLRLSGRIAAALGHLVRDRYIDMDKIRTHSPDVHPDAGLWDIGRNWNAMRRNHRSVTMDLTRPEGREVFLTDRDERRLH
jgi:hypothetical protein